MPPAKASKLKAFAFSVHSYTIPLIRSLSSPAVSPCILVQVALALPSTLEHAVTHVRNFTMSRIICLTLPPVRPLHLFPLAS